jgi:uncharacterized protein
MSAREPKIVLLTGASAGIGAALARELARRGHRLALTARRADRLERLAASLRAGGAEAAAFPADLADVENLGRLVADVVERCGGLDVLINNAGYGLPQLFGRSDPEELRRQVEVNLAAPIVLTRHALPHLVEARGTVINVGSAITAVANPIFGVYGTTKAGLAYWNDALRRELRHRGVRVCLVEPGPVETEFFDAVQALADGAAPLGVAPPPDGIYNAMRDRPPRLLTATADHAARRIARLIDRPRRRLSFLRRMVWPWRALGASIRLAPWLGDVALSAMVRRIERERGGAGQPSGEGADARAGR